MDREMGIGKGDIRGQAINGEDSWPNAAQYRHIDIGISFERTHFLATSICSIRKLHFFLNVQL